MLPWPNWESSLRSNLSTALYTTIALIEEITIIFRDYKLSTLRICLDDHDIEWELIYQTIRLGVFFFRNADNAYGVLITVVKSV